MSRANRALALAVACSCSSKSHDAAPELATQLSNALTTADHTLAPWRCTAEDLPAARDEQLTTGAHHWQLHGHSLHLTEDGDATTIGVIADAGGSAPATLAALGRLRAKLDEAAPDVVLALGGMGESEADLRATLGVLAERAKFAVVALPGDLEPVRAERAALAALRARGAVVLDGRLVRSIELPGATIATVPGVGAASRLVAGGDGCAWSAGDLAHIYGDLATHPGLRIAALAEAPRAKLAGVATGDLGLAPAAAQVDVVVHAPTGPAPSAARSGTRDGRATPLSPGTADATPRLPDPHVPSAGTLVIRGQSWSWRPIVDSR